MKYTTLQGRSKPIILSNKQSNNIINKIQTSFIVPITHKYVYVANDYLYVKEPAINANTSILFTNVNSTDINYIKSGKLQKNQSRLFLKVVGAKNTNFNNVTECDLQHLNCTSINDLISLWNNTINTYSENYNVNLRSKFINYNNISNNPNVQICDVEIIVPDN